MSDIKVGDLVVVVAWHPCGCGLGQIGRVTERWGFGECLGCDKCKREYPPEQHEAVYVDYRLICLRWLKRIPPLDELEGEKNKEELHETS